MKTYIAIPSCRDWKPQFGGSLCGLVHKMTQCGVDFDMGIMLGTSVLPKARQIAIEHAAQLDYTHILFLDDDMSFPPDLFSELAKHNLPVVAVNYGNKTANCTPQSHGIDGNPLSSIGKSGIEEVGWIGFGAVLINLNAIKDIPKPLFEVRWLEDRQSFMGEDYYFCGKLRAHGVSVYINHDISHSIGHIGDFNFREGT